MAVHGLLLDGKPIANFERDDVHWETSRELGNGLTQVTQYDAACRQTYRARAARSWSAAISATRRGN